MMIWTLLNIDALAHAYSSHVAPALSCSNGRRRVSSTENDAPKAVQCGTEIDAADDDHRNYRRPAHGSAWKYASQAAVRSSTPGESKGSPDRASLKAIGG
jgi:hypothetical protein